MTLSPAFRSWRSSSIISATEPERTTAVSRAPGSCSGGSPGRPLPRRLEPVARDVGPLPGQRRGQLLGPVTVAIALAALPAADHDHVLTLVEPQQLREPEVEAGGDPLGGGQRRAGLAALDLRQHRRRDPAALGQVTQRQPHRLAQRPDAGPSADRVPCRRRARLHVCVRYHGRTYSETESARRLRRRPSRAGDPRARASPGRPRRSRRRACPPGARPPMIASGEGAS